MAEAWSSALRKWFAAKSSLDKALAVGRVHKREVERLLPVHTSEGARKWEQARKLVAPCSLVALYRAMVRTSVAVRLADKLWAGSKGRKPESLIADSSPAEAARTIGQRPAGRRILLRQVRSR